MIKRFHALYVGQIELDNIGLQGTPANDRRYPNERLSEVFWTARDVAREMDELGYYAFWTAEHHFQREGYECLPNLIQLGLWLATQTRRLKHLPVEIWMPIASGRTIDMMAKYGLKAMVTLNGEKILDDVVGAFHAACIRHGRPSQLGQDMIWGAGVYLADTREVAIRRLEPSHDERYKWFAPFGFVRYADEQGRTWGTPGAPARVPSLRDGVKQKAWFCGTPAQIIEGIKSIEAKYPGLEDFMIHWAEGLPPREFIEQLQWFAREVMPAFNRG